MVGSDKNRCEEIARDGDGLDEGGGTARAVEGQGDLRKGGEGQ